MYNLANARLCLAAARALFLVSSEFTSSMISLMAEANIEEVKVVLEPPEYILALSRGTSRPHRWQFAQVSPGGAPPR